MLLVSIFSIFFIFSCGEDSKSITESEAIEMCKSMCDYNDCLASGGMTVSQCKSYCSSDNSTPDECDLAVTENCSAEITDAYECAKNCLKQASTCEADSECETACNTEAEAMDSCQSSIPECQ